MPGYGPSAVTAPRDMPGLLPDHLIKELISIEPFAEGIKRPGKISYGLTSSGYDVRLGRKFKVFTNAHCAVIDPKNIDEKAFITIEDADFCMIPPNSYILGESVEYFKIPRDVTCLCVGKSTYARVGIIVNVTPGEPEWEGRWTIEISNSSPIPAKVYADEGIMQVLFFRTVTTCDVSYKDKGGKYQGDQGMRHAAVDGGEPSAYPMQVMKNPALCQLCNGARVIIRTIDGEKQQLPCERCRGTGFEGRVSS